MLEKTGYFLFGMTIATLSGAASIFSMMERLSRLATR